MKIAISSQQGVRSSGASSFAGPRWRSTLSISSLACAIGCSSAGPASSPGSELASKAQQALADGATGDGEPHRCRVNASQPGDGETSAGSSDDSTADGEGSTGDGEDPASDVEDPTEDEDLLFLKENGFETFHFAITCRSLAQDGSSIEDADPLPVGGGRTLECSTASLRSLVAQDALSSTGERFCALGEMASSRGDGDPRLTVEIASSPDGSPWTLVGTHEGDEISLGTVSGFGGGRAWPLWVDAIYKVIDVRPNPTGQLCDPLYGL